MVTLKAMAKLARDGKKNFNVINKARSIIRGCGQKDYACEAASLQSWVRDNVRYVQDPRDVELIQEPAKTLELMAGDCDDKATLLASMLEAIGHQARFVVIATDQPGVFSHVYVETKLGTVWVAAETTEPVPFGWEPPPEIVKSRFNYFL